MQGARNAAPSGRPASPGATGEAARAPLPRLRAGDASPAERAPHRHTCAICAAGYDCDGPDPFDCCAPVCPPCYWAALGAQLESYQQIVGELSRKREEIERRVGIQACRRAERKRRRRANTNAGVVVAMDTMRANR